MDKDLRLEISKLVGQPMSTKLPTPMIIDQIADTTPAEAGEHVYRIATMDSTADVILALDATGTMTPVKRTPLADTEITFQGLDSKLEYILVKDILGSPDVRALARRKMSITRGMDKRELKLVFDAILAKTSGYLPGVNPHEYTVVSGDDLYDTIMGMKHLVEDYGDDFTLIVGSNVKEGLDTYDKDQAATLNYNVRIRQMLEDVGINKVIKISGLVSSSAGESEAAIMDSKKMILVANDSSLPGGEGKPIKFVRRKFNADIAALMGADVENPQRALLVGNSPVIVSGTNTLAYSIYGVESIAFCINIPQSICIADATSLL